MFSQWYLEFDTERQKLSFPAQPDTASLTGLNTFLTDYDTNPTLKHYVKFGCLESIRATLTALRDGWSAKLGAASTEEESSVADDQPLSTDTSSYSTPHSPVEHSPFSSSVASNSPRDAGASRMRVDFLLN